MCGIAGAYEYGSGRPVEAETLRSMLRAIVHRGPDDDGVHVDGNLAIGSRRLSIIDLAAGHQPIANEDGSVVVAFNGEIYNYRQLRRELISRGHRFRSEGDTEVLVHLYEEHGERCVDHLRGMFAFAIWDSRLRRLLVVRDRLGIKPLYFALSGSRLVFASEIKALLPYGDLDVRCDLDSLAAFLLLRYVPTPRTMFEGVEALPPGHLLIADPGGVRMRKWWDLSFQPHEPALSAAEAAERLRALLTDAVESHLVSDVPFGAFLSGGIDSSTVVALMSRSMRDPVKTFAVGFDADGEEMSELPYARMVAEHCGTDHHEVRISAGDFTNLAEKVVWHLDQPIADNACLANHMVAELASTRVKMVLTGEGGDELFAGYARYSAERLSPLLRPLPASVRRLAQSLALRGGPAARARIALYALAQNDERRRLATWFPLMHPEARAELVGDRLNGALERTSPELLFEEPLYRTDARQAINRMLYVDTKLWLVDDLLARGDKMSMASSLEARVPLLDHPLVEFAAGLPPSLKVRGLTRKYLLKRVAADYLPAPIIDRRKKGFPIPMGQWLRGDARSFCRDLLSPAGLGGRGLFDPQALTRIMDQHESGAADRGALLWALISVELWHQLYADAPAATRLAAATH
jgi:asparagine synthase (glutamine-hydrolysing)